MDLLDSVNRYLLESWVVQTRAYDDVGRSEIGRIREVWATMIEPSLYLVASVQQDRPSTEALHSCSFTFVGGMYIHT
jgi:hypothetical protein